MLSDIIDIPPGSLISLVGAGGKTTTMYTLASELARKGMRVVTTTTTNLYFPRHSQTDTLIVSAETSTLLKMVNSAWKWHQHITVAAKTIGAGKIGGLQIDQPYVLLTRGGADVVIVEADGARHKKIKAPAEYEPVVPPQTHIAQLLMCAEAINQPLSAEIAHRPERIAAVLGINLGDILTPEHVARLMTNGQGAMKSIPETADVYLLLTHVTEKNSMFTREVAELVQSSGRGMRVLFSSTPGQWLLPSFW
jgi:probable selenium-dependent hydroxylase accessory protein YqeC